MIAVVFQPLFAIFALFTAVNDTAYADQIALFVPGNIGSDGGNAANDLMPWYAREQRPGPLGAGLVYVRMANPAVRDGII